MWFSIIKNDRRRSFCEKKYLKKEVSYWSEMARNAIKSDFRSSEMARVSHFVNKIKNKQKLRTDLK